MTDSPNRPLIAGISAGLLLLVAAGTMATRSPAVAPTPRVDPGPIVRVPAPAVDPAERGKTATAVLAGGCFWGVQGVFQHVKGVQSAVSGYIGGSAADAHYARVSSGTTGHAEAVQVTYDPAQVSYAQLMQVFFSVVHDPTQLNRQGPDHGSQYRSAIYADDAGMRAASLAYIAQLQRSGVFPAPLATRVDGGKAFYVAEGYHQNYLALHPDALYVRINDLPKVEALRQQYPALYRQTPQLMMTVSVR